MNLRKRLLTIITHPMVQMMVGLAMMVCGIGEVLGDVGEMVVGEFEPSSGHGVLLFGALHTMKSMLELLDGFEKVEVSEDLELAEVRVEADRAA